MRKGDYKIILEYESIFVKSYDYAQKIIYKAKAVHLFVILLVNIFSIMNVYSRCNKRGSQTM